VRAGDAAPEATARWTAGIAPAGRRLAALFWWAWQRLTTHRLFNRLKKIEF